MRVLVTGGAGFIGSHLVNLSLGRLGAEEVEVFDNFSMGSKRNIIYPKRVKVTIGDVRDLEAVKKAVKDKDLIFCCHGQVSHLVSVEDPYLDFSVNSLGSVNVLEMARKYSDDSILVYAGSRSIYGEPLYLPLDEQHPVCPICPYEANKALAEWYFRLYHKYYGMKTLVIRPSNAYGPRQQFQTSKYGVISWFIRQTLLGKPLTVYSDGYQTRDFTYISDAIEGFRLGLKSELWGQHFTISTGRSTTINEVIDLIFKYVGKKVPIKREPERDVDIKHVVVSYAKAEKMLGYRPRVVIEEGIRRTVEFHKKILKRASTKM